CHSRGRGVRGVEPASHRGDGVTQRLPRGGETRLVNPGLQSRYLPLGTRGHGCVQFLPEERGSRQGCYLGTPERGESITPDSEDARETRLTYRPEPQCFRKAPQSGKPSPRQPDEGKPDTRTRFGSQSRAEHVPQASLVHPPGSARKPPGDALQDRQVISADT